MQQSQGLSARPQSADSPSAGSRGPIEHQGANRTADRRSPTGWARSRVVAQGEALLAPSVTKRLIREFVAQPGRHRPPPERLEELTEREREVMGLVAAGLSNHEIAGRLVISPATAKTHVSRAMMKLRVHDRAQLVVLAYESGLVRVPD